MSQFYVSYMKPIKRARIHRGECSNCNEGAGQPGQDKNGSGATGWSEALTLEQAIERAQSYRHRGYKDVEFCGTCLRSKRPLR